LTLARKSSRLKKEQWIGIALISPWIIGVLIFKLLPILASLVISFTDFFMLRPEETRFIGLQNYARIFEDEAVGFVLVQTLALALSSIPLQLGASTVLAGLLSSPRLKGKSLLRTLFFLPSIIPSIAVLFMWIGLANPSTGWINRFLLEPLGATGIDNLFSASTTFLLFAISTLWSIGPGILIMMGAMKSVPVEMEEAARVDGAGPITRFVTITLPIISPAIFFTLVINLIAVFGGVILLDRGNVFSGSVSPYDGYVSRVMFGDFELGYAAALAWVFFALVMVVVVWLFRNSKRWVYYPNQEI
jgi:multiple sugar transport system permease protein